MLEDVVDFTLHHTSRVKPTLLTVEQKDSSKARDTARGALRVISLFPQTLEFGATKPKLICYIKPPISGWSRRWLQMFLAKQQW